METFREAVAVGSGQARLKGATGCLLPSCETDFLSAFGRNEKQEHTEVGHAFFSKQNHKNLLLKSGLKHAGADVYVSDVMWRVFIENPPYGPHNITDLTLGGDDHTRVVFEKLNTLVLAVLCSEVRSEQNSCNYKTCEPRGCDAGVPAVRNVRGRGRGSTWHSGRMDGLNIDPVSGHVSNSLMNEICCGNGEDAKVVCETAHWRNIGK